MSDISIGPSRTHESVFMTPDGSVDSFRSDIRAFDILSDQGLNDKGIQLIKDQVQRISAGYRRPENKLADVLDGGAIWLDSDKVLLLQGFGSLPRCGSGDCSESARALTSEWAGSSQVRHLAKVGLHPFYLEVAAPRLFTDVWHNGKRVRSGHSVVALGSPKDYLENGSDGSFVLIDPALGVIQPMATSSYKQTGFLAVPEVEVRPQPLAITVSQEDGPTDCEDKADGIGDLILGIDEQARFIYTLWFKNTEEGPAPQLRVLDNESDVVLKFDSSTGYLLEADDDRGKEALPIFDRLVDLVLEKGLEFYNEPAISGNQIIADGRAVDRFQEFRYPRDKKTEKYILGLEHAAEMASREGTHFSLRFDEPLCDVN